MFYKYRSLAQDGFYRSVDIILKKRLYSSQYFNLNDPMEGFYLSPEGQLSEEMQYKLQEKMKEIRIVSLSKRNDSTLMWSHYADGHRGIAIGVEINEEMFDIQPVSYGDCITLAENELNLGICKKILCRKLSPWSYEEEVRILTKSRRVPVKIKEIIYGTKINQSVRSVLREIINNSDPSIKIKRVPGLK